MRQKGRRYDQLILELERLEASVARECKLGEAVRRLSKDYDMQKHAHTHMYLVQCTHPSPHLLIGFAELQTDLDELPGDVAGCRLPYWDIQSYLVTSLFPGAKDHPVMHDPQVRGQSSKFTMYIVYLYV